MWYDCYNFILYTYIYIYNKKLWNPWVNRKKISPLEAKIRMTEINNILILKSQPFNTEYKYQKCADVTEHIIGKRIV